MAQCISNLTHFTVFSCQSFAFLFFYILCNIINHFVLVVLLWLLYEAMELNVAFGLQQQSLPLTFFKYNVLMWFEKGQCFTFGWKSVLRTFALKLNIIHYCLYHAPCFVIFMYILLFFWMFWKCLSFQSHSARTKTGLHQQTRQALCKLKCIRIMIIF